MRLETDGAGTAGFAVSFPAARTERDVSRLAAEVYQLPARLADVRRRRVAVSLDEFQAVAAFNGGSVEEALRAAVQHQRQVGYVFAGSEPTLMERMIGPKRPFYKAGPVMRLEKIPVGHLRALHRLSVQAVGYPHRAGFRRGGARGRGPAPVDVQRLAHEVWDDARAEGWRKVGLDHLHVTLRRLLTEQAIVFEGPGNGSPCRSARCCAPSCSRTDRNCSRPMFATGTGSAAPRRSRPPSPP